MDASTTPLNTAILTVCGLYAVQWISLTMTAEHTCLSLQYFDDFVAQILAPISSNETRHFVNRRPRATNPVIRFVLLTVQLLSRISRTIPLSYVFAAHH